jgi:hypothetical protein
LAGTDFFTVEVLTWRGLVTYYVLFFIHLESRRVDIARITDHPNEQWMQQMARNATMEGCGALRHCRYLLHDRDTKYSAAFRAIIETGHVRTLSLPARSPNLNAYAERWVRSVKDECLSKIILFGDLSLERRANMLRTTTLSEIIKESPTSCCSLMSRRCAAQDRCDAASGWVDFCAMTANSCHEAAAVDLRWRNRPQGFCHRFDFLALRGQHRSPVEHLPKFLRRHAFDGHVGA